MSVWQTMVTVGFVVLFGMWLVGAIENRALRNQIADYRTQNQELRTQHFANRRELLAAKEVMRWALEFAADVRRKADVIESMNRLLAHEEFVRQEAADARRAKRKEKVDGR